MDRLISDLLDLPEQVHRGDFVLNLSEGVTAEKAERTLADYVVTPQLADAFDNALTFIKAAIEAKSSKAAYLHGSFGSGKSHFMAVLRAWNGPASSTSGPAARSSCSCPIT
jgi:predicted ATPase